MKINSARLGEIDVPDDKIITMKRPILGFEALTRFCLIEIEDMSPFLWLQSIENETVAFVVVNPLVFWPGYHIDVNSHEIAELHVKQVKSVETYVVVTFGDGPEDMSANLQGPLLINSENNLAKQLVLVNSTYGVRHSVMQAVEALEETVVANMEPALA